MDANRQNSLSVKRNQGLHLLLFSTPWSKPCKQQWEIINNFLSSTENDTEIASIDIDCSPELADKWAIQSIPTTILLNGNREIDRFIGLLSADRIQAILTNCVTTVGQASKLQRDQRR